MKKISFCLLSFLILFVLAGCMQPVFYNIRKEVPLIVPTVTGNVNSIARYTFGDDEYLVTQNGKAVYYKPVDKVRTGEETAWTVRKNETFESLRYEYSIAGYKGEQIIRLAVDDEFIYIITVVMGIDHDEGESSVVERKLYCTDSLDGATWTQIEFPSISLLNSAVFCTNAVSKDGRKAYFRNDKDLYELNGTSQPAIIAPSITDGAASARSVVWFKGSPYFFGTLASATNETFEGGDATMIYYGTSKGIAYSSDGASFTTSEISSVGTISCITATKDFILFGQGDSLSSSAAGGGIYKVPLSDDGVPGPSTVFFTTNADAVFTTSYQLVTLLSIDSSKPEEESIIYASTNFKTSGSSISVSYDNIGLWSYYPKPIRGNWNRE